MKKLSLFFVMSMIASLAIFGTGMARAADEILIGNIQDLNGPNICFHSAVR